MGTEARALLFQACVSQCEISGCYALAFLGRRVFDRLKSGEKPFLCRIVSAHTRGMGRPPLNIDIAPKDQKELT
jgi:hypothetical protein